MQKLDIETDAANAGETSLTDQLLENNRKWVRDGSPIETHGVFGDEHPVAPKLLWIGCSGSNAPPHAMVGLQPGDLFIHRNLANLAPVHDLSFQSALEYALVTLHVRHVVVVGHYGCAAVKQAMDESCGKLTRHWLATLRELALMEKAELSGFASESERLDRLCELSVLHQARCIAEARLVRDFRKKGENLTLHGWIYSKRTGLLTELGPC
ncbi:carbonic anhydrase [Allosphingosinicella humi]